ncbi:MAG: hypothetical protein HQL82_10895 [Magnetococcales bacterium]|nr:hypothetical protein [Magnetococcales bacterium]
MRWPLPWGMVGLLWMLLPTVAAAAEFQLDGPAPQPRCAPCHAWLDADPRPRPLAAPHDSLKVTHGGEGLWCLDCHVQDQQESLRGGRGAVFGWDAAHRSCALCHGATVTAWQVGIHGKRVGNWRGPRTIQACRSCHDAHQPAFRPVPPDPAPPRSRFWRPPSPTPEGPP